MEIIQFDIFGKCAHFRKYYANNTAFTYSLPPRTTIMGMLAAIAGMERDSYYEELASNKIDIGIAVRSPIKKTFHRLNFLSVKSIGDMRKSFDSDFRGMAGNRIQTPFEIVTGHHIGRDSICYRVFLGRREAGGIIFDALKERLLTRNFVYAPTLGVANFQAFITAPVIYTDEQVIEKQPDTEYISFDSAIASENVTDLLFEKEGNAFVEEELLPADFIANYDREMAKMNKVLFTTAGIPLKARSMDKYFVIQNRAATQNIQFL
jgi:CRISPR-associated protein Cas5h